jgi:hypothetical protein
VPLTEGARGLSRNGSGWTAVVVGSTIGASAGETAGSSFRVGPLGPNHPIQTPWVRDTVVRIRLGGGAQMTARYPIEMVNGVPVVAAPEEIDASNAGWLRAVLLEAAARGHETSWWT